MNLNVILSGILALVLSVVLSVVLGVLEFDFRLVPCINLSVYCS